MAQSPANFGKIFIKEKFSGRSTLCVAIWPSGALRRPCGRLHRDVTRLRLKVRAPIEHDCRANDSMQDYYALVTACSVAATNLSYSNTT
jgi:hypothetical protein